MWYADDATSIGKLKAIRSWWDELHLQGPKYGYFPKPSKSVLILKNKDLLNDAKRIFAGTGIKISTDGEFRHLGAVLGSPEFRETYVRDKVSKWVSDIEELSVIARDEPQLY